MTIGELISTGFDYARRCRGLWLFGFLIGLGGGGGGVGNHGGHGGIGPGGIGPHLPPVLIAPLIALAVMLAVAALILHFISEGALIEGVARTRGGESVSTGQGFRDGRKHFGVLFCIGMLVGLAFLLSLAAAAVPIVLGLKLAAGPIAIGVCVLTALILIPWLISLSMIRAFAARIAVLENRRALDALRRARLFLHGRILLGLKMIVAAFAGNIVIALASGMVIVPLVLLLVALAIPLHMLAAAIVLGCILVPPVIFIIGAVSGTMNSSIWTVGYLDEVQA